MNRYGRRFGDARTWVLAPGKNARFWNDFRRGNLIAIGWDDLGDLRELPTRESIHEKMRYLHDAPNPANRSIAIHALMSYQFAHKMRPGDRVVIKRGCLELLGHGVVKSEYKFIDTRPEFKHVRYVEWKKTGRWSLPKEQRLPIKTLTDFGDTRYRTRLRFVFDLMDADANGGERKAGTAL